MTIGSTLSDQIYKEGEPTWGCKYGVVDVEDLKKSLERIRSQISGIVMVETPERDYSIEKILDRILKEIEEEFGTEIAVLTGSEVKEK